MSDLIASLQDGAFELISLDSNVIITSHYSFERGDLEKMKQFSNWKYNFIITDIVYKEIISNYSEFLFKEMQTIQSSLENIFDHSSEDFLAIKNAANIVDKDKCISIATSKIDNFLESTGCITIETSDLVTSSDVFTAYFDCKPPFEEKKSKKHEFPDAFSLMALEQWADDNDKKIVVVSSDAGWTSYCNGNKTIFCVKKIAEALNIFNYQENQESVFVARLSKYVLEETTNEFYTQIADAIMDNIERFEIQAIAESSVTYEAEPYVESVSVTMLYQTTTEGEYFYLTEVDGESISLSCTAMVDIDITCNFDLSVWDSVDREYIQLSSVNKSTTRTARIDVNIELNANIFSEELEFEIVDIDVTGREIDVDFGDLHPFEDDD